MNEAVCMWVKKILTNLDVFAGISGTLIALLIIILSIFNIISQMMIGFVIAFSSIGYLLIRPKLKIINHISIANIPNGSQFTQKIIFNIFFFVFIGMALIIWYGQLYSRPMLYFIILSIISGLLTIEIYAFANEKKYVWVILSKILFFSLFIRAGIYYNFPSILGYDAYSHIYMAKLLSITGYIPPFEISGKYFYYPILHIFISITKIVGLCNIKDAVFYSIGIISVLSTLLIFVFSKRIAGFKIALLSVLLINVSSEIVVRGIANITPDSLNLCYFMVLLVTLLYLHLDNKGSWPWHIILFCLFVLIILTHQLSAFVIFVFLCILYVSEYLFNYIWATRKTNKLNILYLVYFSILMLFYWMQTNMYANKSFFEFTVNSFHSILRFGGKYGSDVLIIGAKSTRSFFDSLILQSTYLILPFFAIAGILFWLSQKDSKKFTIALTTAVLYCIIYMIPLFGIRNLLTSRWIPFITILLCILAASYIISSIELIKSNSIKILTLFTIVALFSFLMVTVPAVNKDNPLVSKQLTMRNQFNDNEIYSAKHLGALYPESIVVDPGFLEAFVFYGSDNTINNLIKLRDRVSTFKDKSTLINISKKQDTMIILRTCTLYETIPLKTTKTLSNDLFDYFKRPNYNIVYTNGNVISNIFD